MHLSREFSFIIIWNQISIENLFIAIFFYHIILNKHVHNLIGELETSALPAVFNKKTFYDDIDFDVIFPQYSYFMMRLQFLIESKIDKITTKK